MRRILVVGISGAGPGWAVNDEFAAQVARIASAPAWIFDSYGYPEVRDLLWEHAMRFGSPEEAAGWLRSQ
jgi:hypothetical protein